MGKNKNKKQTKCQIIMGNKIIIIERDSILVMQKIFWFVLYFLGNILIQHVQNNALRYLADEDARMDEKYE
jgi:hypothetical protein